MDIKDDEDSPPPLVEADEYAAVNTEGVAPIKVPLSIITGEHESWTLAAD